MLKITKYHVFGYTFTSIFLGALFYTSTVYFQSLSDIRGLKLQQTVNERQKINIDSIPSTQLAACPDPAVFARPLHNKMIIFSDADENNPCKLDKKESVDKKKYS